MTTVARKNVSSKSLTVTAQDVVFVGLDVHKKSIHVAVWMNGQVVRHWVMPAKCKLVLAKLEPLRVGLQGVVYEAGPTGYRLARTLRSAGFAVEVIAPSKTPQPAGYSAKTDRLDCLQLAEYAAKGLLRPVAIPSEQEEADRQVIRLRDQVIRKLRRAKQQIKSFLLQFGLDEPAGLEHWSQAGVRALGRLPLAAELRFYLDELLAELGQLQGQLKRVNQRIEQLGGQERHGPAREVLTSHPGVGTIVAMSFRTELFDAGRFSNGLQIGQYLGLAPRVSQSGQTRRDGPICKTGRGYLRSLLIQAAWPWVRRDPAAQKIYQRLLSHSGISQKAIIGMARRLAIHLWRMVTTGELYRVAA
jgi:transposase